MHAIELARKTRGPEAEEADRVLRKGQEEIRAWSQMLASFLYNAPSSTVG